MLEYSAESSAQSAIGRVSVIWHNASPNVYYTLASKPPEKGVVSRLTIYNTNCECYLQRCWCLLLRTVPRIGFTDSVFNVREDGSEVTITLQSEGTNRDPVVVSYVTLVDTANGKPDTQLYNYACTRVLQLQVICIISTLYIIIGEALNTVFAGL